MTRSKLLSTPSIEAPVAIFSSSTNRTYLKMLRRKPTAIAITSDDVAAFENTLIHKLSKENNGQAYVEDGGNAKFDPSDELKPLPGDKARIVRSREDRLGISRRG